MTPSEKLARMKATADKLRAAAEEAMLQVRADVETVGSGAAAGAIRGAFEATGKDYSIKGAPPELVAGGLMKAAAYAKLGGGATTDLHSVSNGVLAFGLGTMTRNYMANRSSVAGRRQRQMGTGKKERELPQNARERIVAEAQRRAAARAA